MAEDIEVHELSPNVEYIKIHGLQRTGTNYLSHLVNENFVDTKVLVNLGGWKHGHYHAPWFLGQEVHILVLVKHPYSWLASMYNYWTKRELRIGMDLRGVSFDTFVRNRAIFEMQRDVPFLFRASNPVQHWNNMYFHWMSIRLNGKKTCFVKYESLLADPEATIMQIGETFQLQRKSSEFVNSESTFTPAGETIRLSEDKFGRDYYQHEEFLKLYTPELIDFVNSQLDLEVLDHYNYWLLPPSEL